MQLALWFTYWYGSGSTPIHHRASAERLFAVPADRRLLSVPSDDRVLFVPFDPTSTTVPR
jgi:hypothetical protein